MIIDKEQLKKIIDENDQIIVLYKIKEGLNAGYINLKAEEIIGLLEIYKNYFLRELEDVN